MPPMPPQALQEHKTLLPPLTTDPLTPSESSHALKSLSHFLTYPTVSSTAPHDGAYKSCADYLIAELRSIPCLEVRILPEPPENCPVVIAKWSGRDPSLPILLLNSHYDVVPITDESAWNYPPFSGAIQEEKIYGRGVQDMKSVCIQYIEAIRKLSLGGYEPLRSIYLSFVPDEEVGGAGMAALLSSEFFKTEIGGPKGVALALDEGLASTTDTYAVFYGERLPFSVYFTAKGPTGHGSRFIPNTAVEQLIQLSNKALAFRRNQRNLLFREESVDGDHSNCAHAVVAKRMSQALSDGREVTLGDVTSLNITTLEAGVKSDEEYAYNCVPPVAKAAMDIRISPHVDPNDVGDMFDTWCRECSADEETGAKISWDFLRDQGTGSMQHATTSINPETNPWYRIFSRTMSSMGCKFTPQVFPAATDSRFLRALGIRAFGFSPIRNSPILLHENNEHLEVDVFLEGVAVYVGLIRSLGGVAEEEVGLKN